MENYKDKLQAKIEARVLKVFGYAFNEEQLIGLLMLEENIFYDEAKERWDLAKYTLKCPVCNQIPCKGHFSFRARRIL